MLNKKLKMTATVLNILQVIPVVILEIFIYMILTYNNNVALNYIPVRLIFVVEIAIVLWMLIPFFIKKNKAAGSPTDITGSPRFISLITNVRIKA